MKLTSFSVENFRSITKANKIEVGQSTILVGPNNEGKSNILRGLTVAFNVIATRNYALGMSRVLVGLRSPDYDWRRDFPIHLQPANPGGCSSFTLEFALAAEDSTAFASEVGLVIADSLHVQIQVGDASFDLILLTNTKGKKKTEHPTEKSKIALFIGKRIMLDHIPSVRTAEKAAAVVSRILSRELRTLEKDPAYEAAVKQLATLQQPVLDAVSQSVKATMMDFLPAIKDVVVQITDEGRSKALTKSAEVIVDDGTATDLRYKGDGVQSLAALALMRHAAETNSSGKHLIIAVEEPESHLHPKAMHSLKSVLRELADKHQVVITTHSPLFVNRNAIAGNIIVNKNEARPASSIEEIRDVLGVVPSDNLRHAELVLLVEGFEDQTALVPLLSIHSPKLKAALESGKLAVDSLNGGSNLAYKLGLVRDAMLCRCHVFLDADSAGKQSFEKAELQGLLTNADVNFAQAIDMKKESEMEDLYDPVFYRDLIWNLHSIDILKSVDFKKKDKKWSARIEKLFKVSGKPWKERTLSILKGQVAALVASDPSHAMFDHRFPVIASLISTLEAKI